MVYFATEPMEHDFNYTEIAAAATAAPAPTGKTVGTFVSDASAGDGDDGEASPLAAAK